jgi:hypothetical protein
MRVGGQLHILASSSFQMSCRCRLDKGLDGPQSQYSCCKGEKRIQYTDEQSRVRVLVNFPKFSTLGNLCSVKLNGSGC